ncbi:glutathione S-transferase theta-1 [Hyalella azteca]|uniref:glutathione transferase n=1 Tax=Hyalella azteca TaxID=294128 RepID=A0A8B7NTD8_HYAAZ|nr:glutathione S-transferase theta-1 [Hyalella azteca]
MLKYYYDLMSQPCRAIYIFLNKTKIPYEKCKVDLKSGEHLRGDFKDIHPFNLVPAINDSGFKLIESVAILRYLCRKYPEYIDDHWYPQDVAKQALVDQYMEWQHSNIRFHGSLFFRHKILIPMMTGDPPRESSVERYRTGLESVLKQFEDYWLKDSKFVAGQEISIADILAVCELYQPALAGYNVFTDHPRLSAWHELVKSELNPEFDEANVIFNKLRAMQDLPKL